ncbi:MAG TPA: helix-turn-helix domain-containing protein [Candidatus Nanoarchaeia archaeon]|nr:helix-turn-helix domain-containing protein [Candidatus Nanoarchaeia archaeon]
MIVSEAFLKKARSSFDLNIYEVKIWTSLLSRGVATAGELSDMSDVPRSRSYDVLESLEKKGFIIMKLGKPIKYIAVQPDEIVKRMKNLIHQDADNKASMLDKVRKEDLFSELELLYKQGVDHIDPATLAGSIQGRSSVYSQLGSMMENAEKEILIMTSHDGFVRKSEKFKNMFKALKQKGVRVKIAAPLSKENQRWTELVKENAQIRHIDHMKARFTIIDGKEMLFMMGDDSKIHEDYDTGIWIKSPYFVDAMRNMFNTAWDGLKNGK